MLGLRILAVLASSIPLINALGSSCTGAIGGGSAASGAAYWMQSIKRQGKSPFNPNAGTYTVFRDVTKPPYNARSDGSADASTAIQNAITDMGRCGNGTCHSSTVSPALIYFPKGTYLLSKPIIPYYYTALVGDPNNKPILKAAANFQGIGVIDTDFYIPGGSGAEWWVPVNNFFRSVRNFVIDTTAVPPTTDPVLGGTGIHWQVGQATSLINVDFKLSSAAGTRHRGIFMENGSGGFMAQLTFTGGDIGMWTGNQQFTFHDITISGANTAIFQAWNWGFTWKNINIKNCGVGWNVTTGGLTLNTQTVGSDVIIDSSISNTPIGIKTSSDSSKYAGSFVIQNTKLSGVTKGFVDGTGKDVMGTGNVNQFVMGDTYTGTSTTKTYQTPKTLAAPQISLPLLDSNGFVYFRTRPQYQTFDASQFVSVKDNGAKGDGTTDDSAAIQATFDKFFGCKIIYFDAGVYKVTKTINIPTGSYVVGEFYATILGSGSAFSNANSPTPILKVGNSGDVGQVEMSDLVVTTVGGSSGAIGIEWNVAGDKQGASGMWDVHVRVGGAKGTNIQSGTCPTGSTATACQGAFLGIHVTKTASVYMENVWVWAADHDLDDNAEGKINSFSGRGIYIDNSNGPNWLVATAAEHHVIYQYSIVNSFNVYLGLAQTETPYYQPTPVAPAPFTALAAWNDPSNSNSGSAWALNIAGSSAIFTYGAGFYSFFINNANVCNDIGISCQKSLVNIDTNSVAIWIYGLSTIGTTNMITVGGNAIALQKDNVDGYQSTLAVWHSSNTTPTQPTPPTPTYPAPVTCTSLYAVAKKHIDEMMTYFVPPPGEGGFWISEPDVDQRLWTDANKWETLYTYMSITGDSDYDIFNQADFPFPDGSSGPNWNNLFQNLGAPASYDDALWTAMMYFRVGDYKKDTDYYKFGNGIMSYVRSNALDTTGACGTNGVWWDSNKNFKNTVTNGLWLLSSAMAADRTPSNTQYLSDAVNAWAWLFSSGIRGTDGTWGDGVHVSSTGCSVDGGTYTYNQGVIPAGLAYLFKMTGGKNTTYLDQAEITINGVFKSTTYTSGGVIREPSCDDSSCGSDKKNGPDHMVFKGLLMKDIMFYIDNAIAAGTQHYGPFAANIQAQYNALIANAQSSDGETSNIWETKNAAGAVFNGYTDQAGIDAILAAIKYGGCGTKVA